MPMNRHHYPLQWPQISQVVRVQRAHNRCECTGECGLDHSAEREAMPTLAAVVSELYPVRDSPHRCLAVNHAPHPITASEVVLTVAHLCEAYCVEMKRTGRKCGCLMHLKAMCQRCHLRTDREQHRRNAARTRRVRRNNQEMFADLFEL